MENVKYTRCVLAFALDLYFSVEFECVFIVCMFERFLFSRSSFFLFPSICVCVCAIFEAASVACFSAFVHFYFGSQNVRVCGGWMAKKKKKIEKSTYFFFSMGTCKEEAVQYKRKNLLKIVHTSMIASYSFYFYFRLIPRKHKIKGRLSLWYWKCFSTSSSSPSVACSASSYSFVLYFFFRYLIGYVRMCIAVVRHHLPPSSTRHCQWSNNDQVVLIFHITVVYIQRPRIHGHTIYIYASPDSFAGFYSTVYIYVESAASMCSWT